MSLAPLQLVSDVSGDDTTLQFGRVAKHRFTMDFQYPLSPLQAFGVCLATLDDKVADGKTWDNVSKLLGK